MTTSVFKSTQTRKTKPGLSEIHVNFTEATNKDNNKLQKDNNNSIITPKASKSSPHKLFDNNKENNDNFDGLELKRSANFFQKGRSTTFYQSDKKLIKLDQDLNRDNKDNINFIQNCDGNIINKI